MFCARRRQNTLTVNTRPPAEALPTGYNRSAAAQFLALLAYIKLGGDAPGTKMTQEAGGLHMREVFESRRASLYDKDA